MISSESDLPLCVVWLQSFSCQAPEGGSGSGVEPPPAEGEGQGGGAQGEGQGEEHKDPTGEGKSDC